MRARRQFSTRGEKDRNLLPLYIGSGAVLLVVLGLFFWGVYGERFQIAKVRVEGNKTLVSEKIIALTEEEIAGKYVWIFPKASTVIYPKDTILSLLTETFPRIKDIEIERDGLAALSIGIVEYEPYGLWCGEWFTGVSDSTEQCYYFDEYGYIFGTASDNEDAFVKQYGMLPNPNIPIRQHVMLQSDFKETKEFLELLDTISLSPKALFWNPDDDYIVYLKGGGELRISMYDNLSEVFSNLSLILKDKDFILLRHDSTQQLQYIDLRFGDRVLYKFGDVHHPQEEDVGEETAGEE